MTTDMDEQIYRDGRHYDCMYGGEGRDVSFYVELARETGGPILELACGTGKYLVPWAVAGFRAVGIDLAQPMLDQAAAKAAQAGLEVELHAADMRDFRLDEKFRLIAIAGNSFCHLHTIDDARRCLECVREQLAPGGTFVIDVFVPDVRLLARDPALRYAYADYDDPDDGTRIRVTHSPRYDSATQINYITTFHRRDGEEREIVGRLDLRMWFPCELEAVVLGAGFAIGRRYGGHDRSEFGARAGKQILVCGAGGG